MTTKSTGHIEGHVKTIVTDNKADKATHKLSEGCAREPMYSHRESYAGVRETYPADSKEGQEMAEWATRWK